MGVDSAEEHHYIDLLDDEGDRLEKARVTEEIEGVRRMHALIANHAADPAEVAVGIETDRGLLVGAPIGAGYEVYALNRWRPTVTGIGAGCREPSRTMLTP